MSKVDDTFESEAIDARNRWGQTRLFRAAEKGDMQLVQKLVADGADISLFDNEKATARIAARRNGHKEIEVYLSDLEQERGVSPEILAEKARLAFETSEAVKKMKAQQQAALAERQRKEKQLAEENKAVWFYSTDLEQRKGPVSIKEIKELLNQGEINKDTLVWSPNINEWKPLIEIIDSVVNTHETETIKKYQAELSQVREDREQTATLPVKKGPRGVGGWLLLLIVGMMVLGPLMGAGRIAGEIAMAEHQYPEIKTLNDWSNYKSIVWWSFAFAALLSIYGGFGLATGKRWVVVGRAKVILWLSGPIASLIMALIIPYIVFGEIEVDPQFFGALIGSLLAAIIWTAYLSKSKRVRNTYSRAHESDQQA